MRDSRVMAALAEAHKQIPEQIQDCAAILFARTPVPGRVKSRLFGHLTPEQACRLHCACTSDMAALLDQALPEARKWLFFSDTPIPQPGFGGLHLPPSFRCAVQEGDTLGNRMGNAFVRALAGGAQRVVIFGSDSPTLPAAFVRQAFASLADSDIVLGPTEDGGYYLIGCRRFDPGLFENVAWSTAQVFAQTQANAQRLGYRMTVLPQWFDLDKWKDVERLLAEFHDGHPVPTHLAAFLRAGGPGNF
ncbi:MAG: TIGR04282 family arsenosugar biosynthesis glycosyltransferase [Acidobacteria bacterium]|nr:TIGR04282 family arsenosugar biosynthesis glycosyltransferase [Acidobacteriota bacterium]